MRKIGNVTTFTQRNVVLYSFKLKANALLEMGRVERFGEGDVGINRQLNPEHALDIAKAMLAGTDKALWLEPFVVALEGGWEFDMKAGVLVGPDVAYLSIDDGQHRHEGFKSLTAAELDTIEFPVVAHLNLPFETRLRVFRMQGLRRPLDARLNLAQRYRLNEWDKPIDREAYELVLRIHKDERSPLKGLVQLNEGVRRIREDHGLSNTGINAQGLFSTLRTVLGNKGPIIDLASSEERAQVILNTLHIASEVWPNAWRSERHILTTARGVTAVLQLFITGTNFRAEIGTDFNPEAIRRGLSLGSSFDWTKGKHKNASWRDIADRLDQSIQRGSRNKRHVASVGDQQ